MRVIVVCAIAIALIAGTGVLWNNQDNVCSPNNPKLPRSFSGEVTTGAHKVVDGVESCWIVMVKDSQTGVEHAVPFNVQSEAEKHTLGSTYSR